MNFPRTIFFAGALLLPWCAAGQAPPGGTPPRPPVDLEAGRKFWSCRPPRAPEAPATRDSLWARRELDAFVLARLEFEGMTPSPDAAPAVLLRRLCLDLTGLPPSPDEAREFLGAWREAAGAGDPPDTEALLQAAVDRLLGSPRFGERWGRHWLDVVRFAESNGRESNVTYPHAWRYRDYVIDALNADVPFDRFIAEQLAGDLLPARDKAERARLLIATGFLALGAKGLNEMNREQFTADLVDEQLDTVCRAFMASSVACARCHDHKTDPFSMEDYYALAGIFHSTETFYGTWIDSENNNGGRLVRLPGLPGQLVPNKALPAAEVARLKASLEALDREEAGQNDYIMKARLQGRDLGPEFPELLRNAIRIYWTRGGITGRLATVDETGRALPLCMGAGEAAKVADVPLLERGEIAHPGKTVPRGFPRVFALGDVPTPPHGQSGRLELARWLAHREHPLTARVMANRVWRHLFGAGLVRTVDDFGVSGEPPSHPELLDHLAVKFVAGGWSVKRLIREIVLSRTYRQASAWRAGGFERDPDNRLLWRAPKRRLDAEVIRDAMLAVAGELDVSRRPGSLVAELDGQSVPLIGFNEKLPADLDGSLRRSVYLPVLRDHLPDVLHLFDFATPALVTGSRDVTHVPMQALYLLNGSFVQERAAALARRLRREAGEDEAGLVRRAFQLCFSREPDATELRLGHGFLSGMRRGGTEDLPPEDSVVLAAFCQSLLATAEFRHVD